MRIGVDVGGTNTDAVLLSDVDGLGAKVLAAAKTSTTADVTAGVVDAIGALLADAVTTGAITVGADGTPDTTAVSAVMIGTTHFTNAVVQQQGLANTAAVRLGLPATAALPPMTGWPASLRQAIGGRRYLCHGGNEYDGSVLSELIPDELRRVAAELSTHDIRSVAISSVFSPVNSGLEREAAEILRAELPGLRVSCSHEFGRLGLLERENATILNAALIELADHIVDALGRALAGAGIQAPLLLSQNDGTLMDIEYARRFPVATFASGPTNSMRGAALLSGLADCAVVDVGGTTADIGIVSGGFPREATAVTSIAGVRTNFRMPDVLSLGIGGGSLVRDFGGATTVGPDSVGYRLTERAIVFGGDVLTLTDLAVAAGRVEIGDPALVAHLDREQAAAVLNATAERVAEAVDRMRTSPNPLPVVAVGGGSVLLPDVLPGGHPGLSEVRRPEHFAVANAVGAAVSEIGGEVDRIFRVGPGQRDNVLAEAKAEAIGRAEAAGAVAGTVRVVDIDEVPLAYLPGGATRIRIKAVGPLDLARIAAGPVAERSHA